MSGKITNHIFVAILAIVSLGYSHALGQTEIVIDSPNPVLISESNSTRALSNPPLRNTRNGRGSFTPRGYQPGQEVTVFVSSLSLMQGEGPNSVRVYAEDSRGRIYRFPVVDFGPVPDMEYVQAVTFRLTDEIGYFPAPIPDGDMLISVSWRGNSSNKVRLAFGRSGGRISDEVGAVPTPLSKASPGFFSKRRSDQAMRPMRRYVVLAMPDGSTTSSRGVTPLTLPPIPTSP